MSQSTEPAARRGMTAEDLCRVHWVADPQIERSPRTYAKNIHTPLPLIHAENDLRCPIEQSEQTFTALKKLGREVMFVRLPDESHRFSAFGKPRHRLQRLRFILDWFAKYLRPER